MFSWALPLSGQTLGKQRMEYHDAMSSLVLSDYLQLQVPNRSVSSVWRELHLLAERSLYSPSNIYLLDWKWINFPRLAPFFFLVFGHWIIPFRSLSFARSVFNSSKVNPKHEGYSDVISCASLKVHANMYGYWTFKGSSYVDSLRLGL